MTLPDDFDASRFAVAFQSFLEAYRAAIPRESSALATRVKEHLGADPAQLPSFLQKFDGTQHQNLQLALETLAEEAESWELLGLPSELRNYGGFSLTGILSGRVGFVPSATTPEFVNLPIGPAETLPCLQLGLFLIRRGGIPLAALLSSGQDHGPRAGLVIEVVSPEQDAVDAFLARLQAVMHERNVYRGKVLSFAVSEYGRYGLTFHPLPTLTRDDVILPAEDLDAIEQHTLGLAAAADRLRAAGRHLKRGLLLYGPPGTGKTLSIMYLCNRMPGRTTVLLSGMAQGAIGQAAAIARSLQPSMVVLEDVDLIAMERTMPGMGSNPVLFQLLNEMDGLDHDADVIFVLTTNRVELLEPALTARPGRIDQAVEIRLPGPESRRQLFNLYLRELGGLSDVDDVVERTEAVSPAFIKELVRRAALLAASDQPRDAALVVDAEHLDRALRDLLHRSSPVLRRTLGLADGSA